MKNYFGKFLIILFVICALVGCAKKHTEEARLGTEIRRENTNDYYLNEQGYLVDKVTEFKTKDFNGYTLEYPILEDGVDEVVVYEFDTYDGNHIVMDASNVYQQVSLDEVGDYGEVELEIVAPGKDIVYMFDGERYYIEDYSRNILTISCPMNE